MVSFSVATDESYTDKQDQKQERVEWHHVVAFGKLADICKEYLQKGRQVYVEGRLRTREYEAKNNGSKRQRTEIVPFECSSSARRRRGGPKRGRLRNRRCRVARCRSENAYRRERPNCVAIASLMLGYRRASVQMGRRPDPRKKCIRRKANELRVEDIRAVKDDVVPFDEADVFSNETSMPLLSSSHLFTTQGGGARNREPIQLQSLLKDTLRVPPDHRGTHS